MKYKYHIAITAINRVTDSMTPKKVHKVTPTFAVTPVNYTQDTIINLFDVAGIMEFPKDYFKVTIYESGSTDLKYLENIRVRYPQVEIVESPEKLNLVQNTNRAMLAASLDSEYTILLQDDAKFTRDAFFSIDEWIDSAPQDAAFLTLWNCGGSSNTNYIPIAPSSFWCSLCLIFKSNDVKDIATAKQMQGITRGHDMGLKRWAIANKKKIYANKEGLVQHQGDYSTLGQRELRKAKNFNTHAVSKQTKTARLTKFKNSKTDIAIAITTYNDVEYTERAIQSLLLHNVPSTKYNYKYYILDNNSKKCNVAEMVARYPEIKYVNHRQPGDLTGMWNKAYELAKNDNCKYLVISNNDVKYSPNWLTNILDTMIKLYSFNVAGPVTNAPGHIPIQTVFKYSHMTEVSPTEESIAALAKEIETAQPIKVNALNGFCMVFKMDFLKTNLIDGKVPFSTKPEYKLFGGEDEFFMRAKPKTMVITNSFVLHYKQVTVAVECARNGWSKQWIRE